jgi:hypothetical protein
LIKKPKSQFCTIEMLSRKLVKIIDDIISNDDEVLVPARKVYLIIKYKHPNIPLPSFPEFVNLIKRSRKFELIDTGETTFYDLPESIEKLLMEVEIYGTGPRIKLRSVKLTPKLMRRSFLKSYERMRAGIEKLLSKISADPDFPSDEINKLISSFAELREQINKTIQMLEKLELYESRSKKRKK